MSEWFEKMEQGERPPFNWQDYDPTNVFLGLCLILSIIVFIVI